MTYKKNKANKRHKSPRSQLGNKPSKGTFFIFGKHPVLAALKNPKREKIRLIGTQNGLNNISDSLNKNPNLKVEVKDQDFISSLTPPDNPNQGLALEVKNLPGLSLQDVSLTEEGKKNIVLVLDQITDPQNIGAIMRSAVAFDAKAIITTDRNTSPETGILAKAASGALDTLPWLRVGNLSSALEELADLGYWRVGLDGYAKDELANINAGNNIALILGSEGKGMREGTKKKCDFLVHLPISKKVESLNVSNAAAVALYEIGRNT